ncbi:hypothetical protein M3649_07820 [Ureibacillus chungkukjangi]|uniref:hypothetical protein n=1 Tax=Ureibacillus chungkukjangi TaxID=1202712 RepID=UPI002040E7DF|nr:hypothetical protein [Ureibacillus chungkukjangi]MCM3388043.1 hypothetical protein [Ureibacillus chungkukjangi]
MSTKVPLKNAVYLLQIKEQLDEIVFNYIDTTQKWEVAYDKLDELLEKATIYYNGFMEANGDKPKENTSAILFLNISFRLIYFHTISYYHLKVTNKEAVKNQVLELITLAANCIPDVQKEGHAEYLNEIAKSYEEISQVKGKQVEFEQSIIEQDNRIVDCFNYYSKASSLFLK